MQLEPDMAAIRPAMPRSLAGRDASAVATVSLPSDHLVFPPGRGGLNTYEQETVRSMASARAHLAQRGLVGGGQERADIRRSDIVWLELNQETHWLFTRVASLAYAANRIAGWNFTITTPGERLQLATYNDREQGMFGWHIDLGSSSAARRKISVVIELESASSGGFLQFSPADPRSVIADLGAATVFPSYLSHRLTPVSAGHRSSLAAWICGPPFR